MFTVEFLYIQCKEDSAYCLVHGNMVPVMARYVSMVKAASWLADCTVHIRGNYSRDGNGNYRVWRPIH